MTAIAVDVSAHQGGANGAPIPKLVKRGAQAIIARASIGNQVDVGLFKNGPALVDAGIPHGYYHFGLSGTSGSAQADTFWNAVKEFVQPNTALVFDAEAPGSVDQAADFAKQLRQHAGDRVVTLYTANWCWRPKGNPDATDYYDALWLAYYTEHRQQLNKSPIETSSVTFDAHGLAGFRHAAMVQFGPIYLDDPDRLIDCDLFAGDIGTWRQKLGDGDGAKGKNGHDGVNGVDSDDNPVVGRPRYRKGANAFLDALIADATQLPVPDSGHGPAWGQGVADARQDAIEALTALRIGPPDDQG